MSARRLLFFNIVFWLLAAGVLFVNSWPRAQSHIDVAYVRYTYFVVVGLLASGAMMLVYGSAWFARQSRRLLWVIVVSAFAALVTAILINPITYMMIGRNIHSVPVEILSTGTLYFALLFVIWSALYLQLKGEPFLHAPPPATDAPRPSPVFQVEKRGEIRQLRADDIVCVRASGDYVDLVTPVNTYLKKDTMTNLEALLDPERFKRIHRSTIVNIGKIERVSPKQGGVFDITLEGGRQVQSSRAYRAVVESIVPNG
jgi:DNA-binding LytR/AlgR family response regulator